MAKGERCLLVHGHFYQPPRENPWTGQIDPQPSADPWENWNLRIADECYLPMARSRVFGKDGGIVDLYNNYAHTSFNFGPTLLSWLETSHPSLLVRLSEAARLDRTFAMAQAYNHMMLPLADTRDRHTQILWGLREFRHRFGFRPRGMWLPECGIDGETVRALIDHRIEFVILSPTQASRVRPFGSRDWLETDEGVDTRRAYRVFETDGGGRTHFDRSLDVLFYTPGLNLKVSFDHLLGRPEDFARELEDCYLPDYDGAQLVSIVTDGEIYGHHEKGGEEALTRLYRDIAPRLGLKIVSAREFLRRYPPTWEAKLWEGEDGKGSSWSCEHGVGRWRRDCGCRPPGPEDWTQEWRAPLRKAFDAVRDRVRFVARRELGTLVWDADEARDGYIDVVLEPTREVRRAFLDRHARRVLDTDGQEKLWRVLEAQRNAMLMYTSCGWFFDELSGLEPVQNMRYALRACELLGPYHDEDLSAMLERELSLAKSNIPQWGDGGGVFRELVLPSRHSNREIAAAVAVCLAMDFPLRGVSWTLVDRTKTGRARDADGGNVFWGSFVCRDAVFNRIFKTSWAARIHDFDNCVIGLHRFEEAQGDVYGAEAECPFVPDEDFSWLREAGTRIREMGREELLRTISEFSVGAARLPDAVREMLYREFSGAEEESILRETTLLGRRAVPFLSRARRQGARVPAAVAASVTGAFEREMSEGMFRAIRAMTFDADAARAVGEAGESARKLGLSPEREAGRRALTLVGMELLHWLSRAGESGWMAGGGVRELPDGGKWLAPLSHACRGVRYSASDGFSDALGRGLAKLWDELAGRDDPALAALTLIPLPELLEFMRSLGLDPGESTALGSEFWDFLDEPLTRLARGAGKDFPESAVRERILRTAELLGYDEAAIRKRITRREAGPDPDSRS